MKLKTNEIKKQLEVNSKQSLKEQKIESSKRFLSMLDMLCYTDLITLYYTDNSVLLLMMRCFTQFILARPPPSKYFRSSPSSDPYTEMSLANRKLVSQKIFSLLVFTALVSIISHCLFLSGSGLSVDPGSGYVDDDARYQYGHLILTLVGERRFDRWFYKCIYMLILDMVLLGMDTVMFCINYSIKLKLSDDIDGEEPVNKEYDGLQGNVLLYRFNLVELLNKVRNYTKDETIDVEPQEDTTNDDNTNNDDTTDTSFMAHIPGSMAGWRFV